MKTAIALALEILATEPEEDVILELSKSHHRYVVEERVRNWEETLDNAKKNNPKILHILKDYDCYHCYLVSYFIRPKYKFDKTNETNVITYRKIDDTKDDKFSLVDQAADQIQEFLKGEYNEVVIHEDYNKFNNIANS